MGDSGLAGLQNAISYRWREMATRREFLGAGVGVGAAAWIAPSVIGLDRVAAAAPSSICEVPVVGDGGMWLDSAPTTLAEGGPLDSNTNTFVFMEAGPVLLTADLQVNRTTAGTFIGTSDPGGTIPAGTWVCSYFIHGDRLDDSGQLTGSMTFSSATILGLIYRNPELNSGSAFLESPATTYVYGPMEGGDDMSFDGGTTLRWEMNFGPHLDQIRVITSCP